MPARRIPDREREIAEDLRVHYGGMLTFTDVGKEFSLRQRRAILDRIDGVPYQLENGRKRWRAADVARRIYEKEIGGTT